MNKGFSLRGEKVGEWLLPQGPHSDIIISSRIRLARNIKDVPFLTRASRDDQERVLNLVAEALEEKGFLKKGQFQKGKELSPLLLAFLSERHLVPLNFGERKIEKGVYVSEGETESILVNEEDHLRLQTLTSGLDLFSGYEKINKMDDALACVIPYAFSPEFGFLTACPTNVGTGMRASILIHLPGLVITKEMGKILRSLITMGLTVRGTYGEGSETKGNLFQISNQITLGLSETEILEKVRKVAEEILDYELKAREFLMKNLRPVIEDKIFRAYAVLKFARLLTSNEATNLLLLVRFGINLGLIKDISLATINTLLILTRPANLQIYFQKEMTEKERDEYRAQFVQTYLKGKAK